MKIKMLLIIITLILFLILTACSKQEINSFEECAAAGNPVMESYPGQCRTDDGRLFVEKIENSNDIGFLSGRIAIGPLCPVERDPPDPNCQPTKETYEAWPIAVFKYGTKTKVSQIDPNLDGSYYLELSAGRYTLNLEKSNMFGSKDLPQDITIKEGETTEINIDMDTGIRSVVPECQDTNCLVADNCNTADDCAPAACCHPDSVVNKEFAPDCSEAICTLSCEGPLDCGAGRIECLENKCAIVSN